ncbi:hypothetical protein RhiirC2_798767 [Rhizophagus irregularis]|uniref:Uncharacterized protein n=1 Tax=Rhizophagus irregularis TaxID=588596 RepID=A0A2N1M5Y1_9GLOM|nr:hypothetical protein RhiirC2_798767 [Rhizophagus irregularis]
MFRIGEIVCKDCRKEENSNEIDERIRELKKIFESSGIIITEGELSRIISIRYTNGEILDKEFIEIFQENKNELERELRKKLDKLLREQAGIINSEENGEKSDNKKSEEEDSDDSEKIGEILSPEEYEIWEENTRDFDENKFENENENVINTEDFDSDTESENKLKNMANQDQIKRIIENALGFASNALDNALGAGQTLADRIQTAGMEGIVGKDPEKYI